MVDIAPLTLVLHTKFSEDRPCGTIVISIFVLP